MQSEQGAAGRQGGAGPRQQLGLGLGSGDGDAAVPRDTHPGDTAGLSLGLRKPAEIRDVAGSSFSSPAVSGSLDLGLPLSHPGFFHCDPR